VKGLQAQEVSSPSCACCQYEKLRTTKLLTSEGDCRGELVVLRCSRVIRRRRGVPISGGVPLSNSPRLPESIDPSLLLDDVNFLERRVSVDILAFIPLELEVCSPVMDESD
jgi:hypothetical protein